MRSSMIERVDGLLDHAAAVSDRHGVARAVMPASVTMVSPTNSRCVTDCMLSAIPSRSGRRAGSSRARDFHCALTCAAGVSASRAAVSADSRALRSRSHRARGCALGSWPADRRSRRGSRGSVRAWRTRTIHRRAGSTPCLGLKCVHSITASRRGASTMMRSMVQIEPRFADRRAPSRRRWLARP